MRRSEQAVRVVAAAVVVTAALALVALAARSGRTATVTPVTTAAPSLTATPAVTSGRYRQPVPDDPAGRNSSGGRTAGLVAVALLILVAILALVASALWYLGPRSRPRPVRRRHPAPASTPDRPGTPPQRADPAPLAEAVDAALRRLEDGEVADAVVACWVLLERAAADAGTERALPETPSELAGRLIDVHDVPAGPLLRLAELYREARYSGHLLPESARTEARAALEAVRAVLASHALATP